MKLLAPMISKKSIRYLLIISIIALITGLILGLTGKVSYVISQIKQSNQNAILATPIQSPCSDNGIFVHCIPDFDHFNLDSFNGEIFPSGYLVGFPYHGNWLIASDIGIYEYEYKQAKYLRMTYSSDMRCIRDVRLIGDSLFILCQSMPFLTIKHDVKPFFARIDLISGKIVKKYFSDAPQTPQLIDSTLVQQGQYIWMSTVDSYYRLDTQNNQMDKFSKTISLPKGVVFYHTYPNPNGSPISMFGENLIPNFIRVTPLHNGKYFLFSTNSLYTMTRNTLPQKIVDYGSSIPIENISCLYIDNEEKNAILFGQNGYGDAHTFSQLLPYFPIIHLDLQTGKFTNLSEHYSKPISAEVPQSFSPFSRCNITANGNTIRITTDNPDFPVISVDAANWSIEFENK